MTANQHPDGTASEVPTVGGRDPLVGALVNGKYRVESAIARGGMGKVYAARQEPLGRGVALKVVRGNGDKEHEARFFKRFLTEASILAKLQHPNVVTIHDYGRVEDSAVEQYFIAMELLVGDTLAERLTRERPMPLRDTLVLARQIGRGLREAHARGIVHRDLKPSNIVLVPEADGEEIVKLVDFGIGKLVATGEDEMDLTQDGALIGTPRYMAPEQFEGHASPASDMYALGIILYQCLTGTFPFAGQSTAEMMLAKLSPAPSLTDVAPDLDAPLGLDPLLARLMAKDPEERPSAQEYGALLGVCEDEVFGASHAAKRAFTSSRWNLPPHDAEKAEKQGVNAPKTSAPPRDPTEVTLAVAPAPPGLAQEDPRARPAAAETSRPSWTTIALVSALAVLALLWWRTADREATPLATATAAVSGAAPPPSATSGTSPTQPAQTRTASPAVDTAPGTITFTIDSVPSGATVAEGDVPLGTTPLSIVMDRARVAASPRAFSIGKDGYVTAHLVQGATSEPAIHTSVTLTPTGETEAQEPQGKHDAGPEIAKPHPDGSRLDIRPDR